MCAEQAKHFSFLRKSSSVSASKRKRGRVTGAQEWHPERGGVNIVDTRPESSDLGEHVFLLIALQTCKINIFSKQNRNIVILRWQHGISASRYGAVAHVIKAMQPVNNCKSTAKRFPVNKCILCQKAFINGSFVCQRRHIANRRNFDIICRWLRRRVLLYMRLADSYEASYSSYEASYSWYMVKQLHTSP